MNNTRTFRSVLLTAIFFAFSACLASILLAPALAQPASDGAAGAGAAVANAALDTAGAVAQPFIVTFAQSHPWLLSLLAIVATLRLVFKPIMSAVGAYVKSTASTGDDAMLEKVEHSAAFKVAAWLLDYLGSIKVGPQRQDGKPAA